MADNKSSGLTVKINVDVSEAITGLKALQREAKEASQALQELKKVFTNELPSQVTFASVPKIDSNQIDTKALIEGLNKISARF
jgi:ribosome-binding factor A